MTDNKLDGDKYPCVSAVDVNAIRQVASWLSLLNFWWVETIAV